MKLPPTWELPESIKKRFGQKRSGKQRAMFADGHLLLVLHQLPKRDEDQREGAFFWRKPTGEWQSSERGTGLGNLRLHLERYEQEEDRLSQALRQAKQADELFTIIQAAAPVSHSAKNLYATLQTAREIVPEDRDLIDLRDQAYDLQRSFELLALDAQHALDFYLARQSEEQIRLSIRTLQSSQRLNILAAIFFPLTALASIFGMNLNNGLENMPVIFFWSLLGTGVCIGFLIRGWVVKDVPPKTNKE